MYETTMSALQCRAISEIFKKNSHTEIEETEFSKFVAWFHTLQYETKNSFIDRIEAEMAAVNCTDFDCASYTRRLANFLVANYVATQILEMSVNDAVTLVDSFKAIVPAKYRKCCIAVEVAEEGPILTFDANQPRTDGERKLCTKFDLVSLGKALLEYEGCTSLVL